MIQEQQASQAQDRESLQQEIMDSQEEPTTDDDVVGDLADKQTRQQAKQQADNLSLLGRVQAQRTGLLDHQRREQEALLSEQATKRKQAQEQLEAENKIQTDLPQATQAAASHEDETSQADAEEEARPSEVTKVKLVPFRRRGPRQNHLKSKAD